MIVYHLVQKGDTVLAMAKKYKTTPEFIVEHNELASVDKIFIGQILEVQMPVEIVNNGDTLSKIAMQNGTTYQELARINGIKAPYTIFLNEMLELIQVFDEQIRFINSQNKPIMLADYALTLEYGIKVFGITNEDGYADRVYTNIPMKILSAEILEGEINE